MRSALRGEKSQLRALDRIVPILPLRPGLPEKQTQDYVWHSTPRCSPPSKSPPVR